VEDRRRIIHIIYYYETDDSQGSFSHEGRPMTSSELLQRLEEQSGIPQIDVMVIYHESQTQDGTPFIIDYKRQE
jgi:hypothetical protein